MCLIKFNDSSAAEAIGCMQYNHQSKIHRKKIYKIIQFVHMISLKKSKIKFVIIIVYVDNLKKSTRAITYLKKEFKIKHVWNRTKFRLTWCSRVS